MKRIGRTKQIGDWGGGDGPEAVKGVYHHHRERPTSGLEISMQNKVLLRCESSRGKHYNQGRPFTEGSGKNHT